MFLIRCSILNYVNWLRYRRADNILYGKYSIVCIPAKKKKKYRLERHWYRETDVLKDNLNLSIDIWVPRFARPTSSVGEPHSVEFFHRQIAWPKQHPGWPQGSEATTQNNSICLYVSAKLKPWLHSYVQGSAFREFLRLHPRVAPGWCSLRVRVCKDESMLVCSVRVVHAFVWG